MFKDKAKIIVSRGKGGDGHVSFRREKFVPAGGPDGGDGGDGGSVYLEVDEGLNTLVDFRHVRKYKAQNGEDGKQKRCAGKRGKDLVLKVPEGTVVRELTTGKVITDMSGENRRFLLLKGGRGGNGNMHYATSTMQAPKYAQPGQPAKTLELLLELKVIADVGLVGFPNVGKSTLLSMVSNARPKVANYHFTTLTPILGVVDLDGAGGFVMADIPGLIEGAAEGLGLGHEFLAHIERTKVLIHVVDASGSEGRDPIEDIIAINKELAGYNVDLTKKRQIIAANKMDLVPGEEMEDPEFNPVTRIRAYLDSTDPDVEIYPISAATGQGIRELLYHVSDILASLPKEVRIYEQEFNPEEELADEDVPFTIERDPKTGEYHVEGPRIEKMLGYTNLETEKGFLFLQKFIEDNGIVKMLRDAGCKEGDTVRMYGHAFDFYE